MLVSVKFHVAKREVWMLLCVVIRHVEASSGCERLCGRRRRESLKPVFYLVASVVRLKAVWVLMPNRSHWHHHPAL